MEKKAEIEENINIVMREQIEKGNICPICASKNMDKDAYPTIFCFDCGMFWDLQDNEYGEFKKENK